MRSVVAALIPALLSLAIAALAADTPEEFLDRHWRRPLAPQGLPPARYTALEASLEPTACGACHPAQFEDWKTTRHARAMSAGVAGQLVEMLEGQADSALACYTCHAPLAEQSPRARDSHGVSDPALPGQGVLCAACHVRGHERFGPPRRDGTLETPTPRAELPHNGVTRTPAFLRSEFCASCHQFASDGFALNGKLLENTVNEWKASRFARDGVQCQDCHMPTRRHLWRGIHDKAMVRAGLRITVRGGAPGRDRSAFSATVVVENTGVGHAFPTYVTPRVVMRGELIDANGRLIAGSRQENTIERLVELDLSRELKDTRLLPGQRAALHYRPRLEARATAARLSVVVFPDAFYTRFFESLLREGAGRGAAQIRQALAETERSSFTVWSHELPVR
jgi:Cytochrome c554 and c-prime